LEVEDIVLYKVRIAILWLFSEVAFLGIVVITFLKPGILSDILSGNIQGMQIGQELLAFYAFIVLFPLTMAFLTVTIKNSINRPLNIAAGVLGVILSFIGISDQFTNPYAYAVAIWVAKILVDASIIWYAYKWPK
jgi:fucose 4-O-acetylase-like acetyltransferase